MSQERLKPPSLEDKKAFFNQLDQVFERCEDDKDEDEELSELGNLFRSARPPTIRSKESKQPTQTPKPVPVEDLVPNTSFKTPQRPPLSSAEVEVVPDTIVTRRHTSPAMSAGGRPRGSTKKRNEDNGVGVTPRPGPGKRRKTEPAPASLPIDKQIFLGLKFFYVPNDTKNKFRQMLKEKASTYGAIVLDKWSPSITHLIIDDPYTFPQALQSLKLEKISENITVVKTRYQSDCVERRCLVDSKLPRYQVEGHQLLASKSTGTGSGSDSRPSTSGSESLKVKEKINKPGLEETPSDDSTPRPKDQERTYSGLTFLPKKRENVYDIPGVSKPSVTIDQNSKETITHLKGQTSGAKDDFQEAVELSKAGLDEFIDEVASSDDESSEDERSGSEDEREVNTRRGQLGRLRKNKNPEDYAKYFQCFEKHDGTENDENPNKRTIEVLSELQKYYESINDNWRSIGYRKAITTLKGQTTKIIWAKDAVKLKGIGDRIAKKVEEIALTNHLRRLEFAKKDSENNLLNVFLGVYGAGTVQAQAWVSAGYKDLEDLYKRAPLNPSQKVGVEHYQDFKQRIPRDEVKAHRDIVVKAAADLDPELQLEIMGSYRRGARDCGDIDILITKEDADAKELNATMEELVSILFERNFLCVGLATSRKNDGSKWHGASKIAEDAPWRRIDFLAVPWKERGAALLYFTGNDIFNRSLRLLASKKGYRLNQRGLYKNVMRGQNRVKITEGELVEGESEKKILEILGVPYRPPNERNC